MISFSVLGLSFFFFKSRSAVVSKLFFFFTLLSIKIFEQTLIMNLYSFLNEFHALLCYHVHYKAHTIQALRTVMESQISQMGTHL